MILTGMVISTDYLRQIQTIYHPDLVRIPFAQMVADWCLAYLDEYGEAPGKHIEDIFHHHLRAGMDEDLARAIEQFLTSLSEEFDEQDGFNLQYTLDKTEERFRSQSLSNLSEDVSALITAGQMLEAEQMVSGYRRVERPSGTGINVLEDDEAIRQAFEQEQESVMSFPGALGWMLNDHLIRGGFLGLMAPEKRGKTWWLSVFARRGVQCRCNTAFFGCGDMSQNQMIRRLMSMFSKTPYMRRYCAGIWIPVVDCWRNQTNRCADENRTCDEGLPEELIRKIKEGGASDEIMAEAPEGYSPCTACRKDHPAHFRGAVWYRKQETQEPLTWRKAVEKLKRIRKRMRGRSFKLETYPTDTLTVDSIRATLDIWENVEGFVPDLIIIDYADIMDAVVAQKDERHKQNKIWKGLRALSLERHCLVVTATQSDAASYEQTSLKLANFSEDKRKYAHVTGMLALNQTDSERRRGLMRLSWLLLREGEYDRDRYATILYNYQTGQPLIDSI